jgi:hypothetical protein
VGDGILFAEITEQRRERGKPVPDRASAEPAVRELVAPGDDVRGSRRGIPPAGRYR